MARVFISYKRKNWEQVFPIVKSIEKQLGIKCWVDLDGIESSAQFASVICKAIDSADIVLFMHSSIHLNIDFENDWTIKELNYAQAKKKRVILVKLDAADLDNVFLMNYGSKNNIDSRDQIQLQKLISDMRKWLKLPQHLPTSTITSLPLQETDETRRSSDLSEDIPKIRGDIKAFTFNWETPEEMKLCATYIDMVIHQKWLRIGDIKKQVEALAQQGKTEAEYAIGFGEYRPYGSNIRVGGDQHYRLAEQWLEKAAKKGHIKAQTTLADMYYWGKEPYKAIPWAKSATQKGNPNAARILAWCYRELNDTSQYIESIKIAAQLQESTKNRDIHSPALEYGKRLLEGTMTKQDLKEAIHWFDVAKLLSYDSYKSRDAIYYKAEALYKQGNKLRALWCLGDASDDDYRATTLQKKITSELNPFSILSRKK